MSQGSNFKQQVMEALFNAPTNLINNKAVMWAASNLPDEGGNGEYNTTLRSPYDHDAENFWEALGINDVETIETKFARVLAEYAANNQNNPDARKSMAFQYVESKLGAEGMLFLAVHGFVKHYEQIQMSQIKGLSLGDLSGISDASPRDLEGLIKHLIELRKRLGGAE